MPQGRLWPAGCGADAPFCCGPRVACSPCCSVAATGTLRGRGVTELLPLQKVLRCGLHAPVWTVFPSLSTHSLFVCAVDVDVNVSFAVAVCVCVCVCVSSAAHVTRLRRALTVTSTASSNVKPVDAAGALSYVPALLPRCASSSLPALNALFGNGCRNAVLCNVVSVSLLLSPCLCRPASASLSRLSLFVCVVVLVYTISLRSPRHT